MIPQCSFVQSNAAGAPRRNRAAYSVLIGIILLTIPCYLIGFAALFILQRPSAGAGATLTPTARGLPTLAFPTPTLGEVSLGFTPPVIATSPMWPTIPPTPNKPPVTIPRPAKPTATATETATPTATASPTPTATETATLTATFTNTPTSTEPLPTDVSAPAATHTPDSSAPTLVPTATDVTPAP